MHTKNSTTKLLSELKIGQKAKIVGFTQDNSITQRMEEMGITPLEIVEVVRHAPLGDPIEIKIRGYSLSLRKDEAKYIKVHI